MKPLALAGFFRTRLKRIAWKAWRGLREWSGDAAYDRYLRSPARRSGTCRPLAAKEFYVDELNRRYSRPNRCC